MTSFQRQVIIKPEGDCLSGKIPKKCQLFDILPKKMPEMRGMIALVLAILLGFLAGCQVINPPVIDPAEEIINKIHTEFNKADIELAIAWDAINRGDYEIAKTKTYNARSYIETAFKYYRIIEDKLTEVDRTHWLTHFELYRINVDLTLIDIDWWISSDELNRLLEGDINERLIQAV